MIVCDTGPLVAAAVTDDDHHHACVELITGLNVAGRQLLVPSTVMALADRLGFTEVANPGSSARPVARLRDFMIVANGNLPHFLPVSAA